MTKIGKQTWSFTNHIPRVLSTGTVAGKLESEGPLGQFFDMCHQNDRIDGDTWEHSEQIFFDEATQIALQKAKLTYEDIDVMIGGDLNAQLISFYLALRPFSIPSLGVYSACASICEGLSLGALLIDTQYANRVLVGTSSHTSSAERQFRYPTEYGAQKPPTAQRTVTGAGMAVLSDSGSNIAITSATIGKVIDMGIQSPWEMGAAMAPAALDTLITHFEDTHTKPEDYDCIATGDLGHIGHQILSELLAQKGFSMDKKLTDCGMLIYSKNQSEVFSGGSGGACCTLVTFAHLLKELSSGGMKRILISATGALLSAISAQQKDSIPGISHAIVFERKDEVH